MTKRLDLLLAAMLTAAQPVAAAPAEEAVDDGATGVEATGSDDTHERLLPLYRDWFEERGVELPLPFGVGLMSIYMERDIEVTDVAVQFGQRPPESISDRIDFEVANQTRSVATRLDTWVLPFLNVYAIAGRASTETSLRSRFTIERPVGDPIEVDVTENSSVDGPMVGLGMTAVVGGEAWFAMADANYTIADVDLFDDEIRAWLLSGRLGWHGSTRWGATRAWGGLFYLDSERTLTITEELPLIGRTEILVTQRPVNPMTYQLGASVTVARHWELMAELGTNFDDATMFVLSAGYRF